jgi:hypothetical protein
MAPRMTVAAVSAPTAASTGEDMSMGASQVAENVSPQVVMVTGKPVCAQASAYDPGGFPRCPRHAKRAYASSQDELRTRPEDESVRRTPSYGGSRGRRV